MQFQAPFPHEALPTGLQEVMWDVCNQTQAPPAMIYTALMVAIATAGQDTYRVQRREGLISNISIYTLCIASSGERKSTIEKMVFKPLYEIQARMEKEHAVSMAEYKVAQQKWAIKERVIAEKCNKALRKGNEDPGIFDELIEHSRHKPEEPACAKLFYSDTTIEAWLSGLHCNSRSSTLLDDEGGRTLKGPLMRSIGQLCSLWDGKNVDVQRKQSGSFSVESPRVSASIQVQPKIFEDFLKNKGNEARPSGLLARFLICHPASTIGYRFDRNLSWRCDALNRFHERLHQLLSRKDNITLAFSPDAQAIWIDHYNDIEYKMAPGGCFSEHQDFGSKVPENTARLAALIHLSFDDSNQISGDTLRAAIAVMTWYCNETIQIFGVASEQSQFMNDCFALEAFLSRCHSQGMDLVRTKHILQFGPSRIRKRSALTPLLNFLHANGRCQLFMSTKTLHVRLVPVNNYNLQSNLNSQVSYPAF